MMFCQRCGSPMKEGQAFCGKCGAAAPSQLSTTESVTPITSETAIPESGDFSALIPEATPQVKKRIWPKIVIPIVALVLVAALAVGAYFTFFAVSEKDVFGKWKLYLTVEEFVTLMSIEVPSDMQSEISAMGDLVMPLYIWFRNGDDFSTGTGDDIFSISLDKGDEGTKFLIEYEVRRLGKSYEEVLLENNMTDAQYREKVRGEIAYYNYDYNLPTVFDHRKVEAIWSFEGEKVYIGRDKSAWAEISGDIMTLQSNRTDGQCFVLTRVDD